MNTLLVILLFVFAGVGLMVVLGEKFTKPADPEKLHKITRWIYPLVGLAIVLRMITYWWE